jgi:hypothetical protein
MIDFSPTFLALISRLLHQQPDLEWTPLKPTSNQKRWRLVSGHSLRLRSRKTTR